MEQEEQRAQLVEEHKEELQLLVLYHLLVEQVEHQDHQIIQVQMEDQVQELVEEEQTLQEEQVTHLQLIHLKVKMEAHQDLAQVHHTTLHQEVQVEQVEQVAQVQMEQPVEQVVLM